MSEPPNHPDRLNEQGGAIPAAPPSTSEQPLPPPTPPPVAPLGYAGGIEQNPEARQWAMITHLSALVTLVGIPSFLGPLVVWLIKKNDFAFVDDQGKEALNFHLTMLIVALVITPTVCIGIGVPLLAILVIAVVVLSIMAGVKANNGEAYRYPMTFRFIK